MSASFGTSGLRGTAFALEAGAAFAHVEAFCRYLIDRGLATTGDKIYVGRDLRPSSPGLATDCRAAIAASGLTSADCGAVPTPALACFAMKRQCAAVMVTGSHIPADRNGIKFYSPDGEITKAEEAEITKRLRPCDAPPGVGSETAVPGADDLNRQVMAEWRQRYAGLFPAGFLSRLGIGVHQHSSVATSFLADLLGEHGARVSRFGRSSTFVAFDTEAVAPRHLDLYASRLAEGGFYAIATADPDGDRPLLVDETGMALRGDLLGWTTALWLGAEFGLGSGECQFGDHIDQRRHRHAYQDRLAPCCRGDAGGDCRRRQARGRLRTQWRLPAWNEGDDRQERAGPLPTRDSILPILATLRYTTRARLPLSALATTMGFRPAASDRMADFAESRSRRLMAWLAADPANVATFVGPFGKVRATDWTDGVRITLAGGDVVHVRPSGSAPEMRCYAEAATDAEARALVKRGLQRVAQLTEFRQLNGNGWLMPG